mgnify:CR=1 FL=1
MTKKVLIDLEQLDGLLQDIIGDGIVGIKKLYYDDKQAKRWFDTQPAAPQWVSVEDRLPDIGEEVLVRFKSQYRDVSARLAKRYHEKCFSEIAEEKKKLAEIKKTFNKP